jgi:hypothetical protein
LTKPTLNKQPAFDDEIDSGGALAAPAWWQREYGCIDEETYQEIIKANPRQARLAKEHYLKTEKQDALTRPEN